jgi:NAD(P)-dependent dehydrogenase (short-subunit alcohol dehydrogenase family)
VLLEGKSALVTGGGRGIGKAIALTFAKAGADLVLAARSREQLEAVALQVRALGRKCVVCPTDLTQPPQVRALARTALAQMGKVDILVNNAGAFLVRPVAETSDEEWSRVLDTNLRAPFLLTRELIPHFQQRRGGTIINIASLAGKRPYEGQGAYCASKHGLIGLSKVLALELQPYNVRVTAICPGGVDTELTRGVMERPDWLDPQDVADLALYLVTLSPKAAVDEVLLRRFTAQPL